MSRVKRSVACIVGIAALMVLVGNQPAPGQSKPAARKLDLAHIIPPPESGAIGFKYLADEVTKRSNGALDVRPVITHVLGWSQFDEAVELQRSGRAGKIVLRRDHE